LFSDPAKQKRPFDDNQTVIPDDAMETPEIKKKPILEELMMTIRLLTTKDSGCIKDHLNLKLKWGQTLWKIS
jgi:hypothetical protein